MKWWLILAALPLQAHVMSVSTGDVTVAGSRVDYVLRMPIYELAHVEHPETRLLQHISFGNGKMQHSQCFQDAESYVCAADYLFDEPVETLDATCTLYAVTTPNHVHILRAKKGAREDQAFFDYTFTNAKLRFGPVSPLLSAVRQAAEGAFRAVGGVLQWLFLITLILAARTRRELAMLCAAFLAGSVLGMCVRTPVPARLAECAAALSVAYLAVEILFLPNGKARWVVAAVLGAVQGVYLAPLLPPAVYSVAGATAATAAVCLAGGWLLLGRLPRFTASLPLAAGLIWFLMRLND